VKKLIICILFLALFLVVKQNSFAVPVLQLYIEGSDYDASSETWITNSPSFKLWVLGNVDGEGSHGSILGVNLVTAFATSEMGSGSTITLTPATTSLVTDPSTPSTPGTPSYGVDVAPPFPSGSGEAPAHGIYGPGVSWNLYSIGDFTLTDSPVGDVITSFPPTWTQNKGQINVYDVNITGYSLVHFDAYDHYVQGGKLKFVKAPFSHDAESSGSPIPEPSTIFMMGSGLAGLLTLGSLRNKRKTS